MGSLIPDQHIAVVVGQGLAQACQPVCIEALDVIEVHLRDAVVEEVLQSYPTLSLRKCLAVEAVARTGRDVRKPKASFVD